MTRRRCYDACVRPGSASATARHPGHGFAQQIKALLPEDREWLAEHGWQEPAPYPEIGTERLRWLS